ncbi:MAG: hypothetical protein PF574_10335 [Candidatus Delongbacteria bacterium]|jgi:rubrerythrin|nr:hypothetical protein [Candidatus Delongbacteria bacterium]
MSNKEENFEIIELLAFHEEAIGNLYSVLKVYFHEMEIWEFLSNEEFKHAEWIRSILDNVVEGSVQFDKRYFSIDNISKSIESIVDFRLKFEKKGAKLSEVIDFAKSLENSIIERKMFDSFWSDLKGIQKVLDDLKADTESHKVTLDIELDKLLEIHKSKEEERKEIDKGLILLGYHAEHERMISQLYSYYRKKFPKEGVWLFLVEEEKKHEAWIKQIIIKINEGKIKFDHRDSSIEDVKISLQNVKDEMAKVFTDEYVLNTAYSFAFVLENSIIEKDLFKLFESDDPIIAEILKNLSNDTKKHRDIMNSIRVKNIINFD